MRKVALWALVVGTLLACGTFNLTDVATITESGTVPAGGVTDHTFSATEQSPVTISVSTEDESFDAVLEVLDSSGDVVADSDIGADGMQELLIFTPSASGTYTARISEFSGDAGSYEISIVSQSSGEDTAGDDARLAPTASVEESDDDGQEVEGTPRIPPTWTPLSGAIGAGEPAPGGGTAVPGVPPDAETYTVQPGDTLANIAFQYGVSVFDLAEANNIENIDLIEVGQVLIIP